MQSFHVFHLKYYLTFFNLNKQAFSNSYAKSKKTPFSGAPK
ncbi:hypothetical protein SC09_Contig24orf00441 [Bacillus subtilis]|uniref:Uncharacterized protein n=1 Tax=Bacillus subtilis TaxID=1423 RepID=A0A0D1IQ18_BACIU|nr:hypothetical protein SC09_Contig24orf00441 [Bacillus subtilis]